jgi:hypothetical protein
MADEQTTDHAGENQENEKAFIPPKDGSWVPRHRLDQELTKRRDLEEELMELKTAATSTPTPTRAELIKKVEDGELSQADADAIWERELTSKIVGQLSGALTQREIVQKHTAEIEKYRELVPEMADDSSPIHAGIVEEYSYLTTTLGMPENTATMIAAVRTKLGSLEKLRVKGTRRTETHQESGGGGDEGGGKVDTRISKLPKEKRDYYANMIRIGSYKDWDAVFKLLEKYPARN